MPKKCLKQREARNKANPVWHYVEMDIDETGWYEMWDYGESWRHGNNVFTLKKDQEYTVTFDMNWQDPEMAKDFSIIAQGVDGGEIEITHWKGLKSATLPLIQA